MLLSNLLCALNFETQVAVRTYKIKKKSSGQIQTTSALRAYDAQTGKTGGEQMNWQVKVKLSFIVNFAMCTGYTQDQNIIPPD